LRRFHGRRGGSDTTGRGLDREFLLCRRAPRLRFRLPCPAFPRGSGFGLPSRCLDGRHYSVLLCCPALETGPTTNGDTTTRRSKKPGYLRRTRRRRFPTDEAKSHPKFGRHPARVRPALAQGHKPSIPGRLGRTRCNLRHPLIC
jgi:hypothetical protein